MVWTISGHFGACFIPIKYSQTTDFPFIFYGVHSKEKVQACFLGTYGGIFTPQPHPSQPYGHGTKQTSTYRIRPMVERYGPRESAIYLSAGMGFGGL